MKKNAKILAIVLLCAVWSDIVSIVVNAALYGQDMTVGSLIGSALCVLITMLITIAVLKGMERIKHRKNQ